jgi:DNA-binding LacI/PurR family transcriptional regulator
MAERRSKVTMLDIARASGVSLSTVSLALNDKPGLPPDTRLKVQSMARKLGYEIRVPISVPSKLSLVHTIGVLVNSAEGDAALPSSDLFFAHVIAGIEATCRMESISLLYSTHPASGANGSETPRIVQDPRIDGLLLLGNFVEDSLVNTVRQRHLPVVLVEAYGSSGEYDSVLVDNEIGAYKAAEYLIGHGHRHIAFLGSYPNSRTSYLLRRQSYVRALKDHGIATTYFGDCHPNNREEIISVTRSLLTNHPEISAILGCSDEVAIIAMHGIMETGRSVPKDISVAGFENHTISQNAIPPLSTIHVDKAGMGRLAVHLLINRAENPLQGYVTMHMHTHLVERQSVRKIGQAVMA